MQIDEVVIKESCENNNQKSTSKEPSLYFLKNIRIITTLLSIVLSIIALYNLDLVNRDGFLYLETADKFLDGGLSAASANYNWPFYSIISALISSFLGLSVLHSFYLLSIIFFGLIAYFYIRTCELYFSSKRELIIAAIIFLCAATVNSYRDQIVRDHGYWAFTLCSVYFLISACIKNTPKDLLFSILAIFTSIFFRVEGAINLAAFPLIFFYSTNRIKKPGKKTVLLTLVALTCLGLIAYLSLPHANLKLGNDIRHYTNLGSYFQKLAYHGSLLKDQILPKYSHDYTLPFIISGLTSILIIKIFTSIGAAYLVGLLIYVKRFFLWLKRNKAFSLTLTSLLLPLIVFLYQQYFLSSRYVAMVSILLLIPVSYIFHHVFFEKKEKSIKYFFVFILIYSFIDSIYTFNKTDRAYYLEAASWIKNNTTPDERTVTNEKRLNYLINKEYSKTTPINIKNLDKITADNIVLKINKSDKITDNSLAKSKKWIKAIEFENNKKTRIVILKNKNTST